MATLKQGILGGFSGKVGTVVGASWRGIEYIRGVGKKRTGTPTETQLATQAKFTLARAFVQATLGAFQQGYRSVSGATVMNLAMSQVIKGALTGTYPSFSISYGLVMFSKGTLPNVVSPSAEPDGAGIIAFSWTDNSGLARAKATDKALLVAYCEDLQQCIFLVGPLRSAGSANLTVEGFNGKAVQTWIGFVSENGKDIANSLFTGEVNVV